ncbi:MAG TPA: polysaccharide biosynthesis/export family protein [Flavisolibacter sp.]|nr:polysaccharide biosynthesis/export family protein [Flavisolibacter sp.]
MRKYLSVRPYFGIFLLVALISFSCNTQKNTSYFQTIPYNSEIQTLITKDFEHRVKPDDVLTITIVSPSDEVKNYNMMLDGYLVDKNGNIQVYKLGDIKVLDLTLTQIKDKITKMLVPDIFVRASVSVRFKNHRVVVLGEVGAPGIIPLETEHISIIEAIASKGDVRESARKDNILVIRNTPRGKLFYRVNLLDGSVFNSPFYYLQADDIVYVESDPEKKKSSNTQAIIGYVLSGVSLLLLIFDRINR